MVYHQKLVAVIKYNGKILREKDNNTVYLPFLAEYELFIKNLESRDAVLNISIDGQDILDNQQLVVKANQTCTLEGFLKGNTITNKFKFIQKTNKIQDFRGDKIDDGLIRIEYQFTKLNHSITEIHHHHIDHGHFHHPYWCVCSRCRPFIQYPQPYYFTSYPIQHSIGAGGGGAIYGMNSGSISESPVNSYHLSSNVSGSINNIGAGGGSSNSGGAGGAVGQSHVCTTDAFMPQFDNPAEAEGITVKGTEVNTTLSQVQVSPLEDNSFTIIIRLSGYDNTKNQPVEKPVLVRAKVKCSTCGRQSKSHIKYCPECGTFLG